MTRPWQWARSWPLWQAPRHAVLLVLVIDAVAIAAAVATAGMVPVHGIDLIRAGLLAGCAWAHIEAARAIERHRELVAGSGPYLDTKAVWSVAAAVILPPALASAIVVFTYTIAWLRIWPRQRPLRLYRWVFSGCTILLGTQVAVAVLALGLHPYPGLPAPDWKGLIGLAVIAAALALRWLLNYGLVTAAILVSSPTTTLAKVLEDIDQQLQEVGAYALGVVAAALAVLSPPLLLTIVLAIVALHRGLLLQQYRTASRTDSGTGLHTLDWWHTVAARALERARMHDTTVAVLVADLDHFKQVNDRNGHLAGDRVLRAVADALRAEVREHDLVGRWGGEEFALLLLDVDAEQTRVVAERIRHHINALSVPVSSADGDDRVIEGLTVSIGAVLLPNPGLDGLDDALRAADGMLYQVKNNGRDDVLIG